MTTIHRRIEASVLAALCVAVTSGPAAAEEPPPPFATFPAPPK